MEITPQSISESLIKFVSDAPGKVVLGARLGGLIRAAHPTFSPSLFHSRNLRQFIHTHVPEIIERGRSGPDYYYGLASNGEGVALPALSAPPFSSRSRTTFDWKVYSNPSNPFAVVANRLTGELEIRTQRSGLSEPWVEVPKPTSEDHLQIAREFVKTLPETAQPPLSSLLNDSLWYVSFSATARNCGVGSSWAAFRTSHLRNRFSTSLAELGISKTTERPWSKPAYIPYPNSPPTREAPTVQNLQGSSREAAIRKLVQLVVAELPLNALLELALPIGKVIDHIDEILK